MKSAKQIEQSIRRLSIEADTETQERILRDLAQTHAQQKRKTQAFGLRHYGRLIMMQKPRRVAAGIAVALLLLGLFSLGSGSVAFSQARHAVSSTLSRLKAMITGDTDTTDVPTELEATPNPDGREVVCATRFFSVPPAERDIWRHLKDQGIELIQASVDPEVYYAAISRQQAASLDASLTLKCVAAPRVTVLEGETA
ncbi:MAG: hypothetical protein ACM3VT_18010, partial [Solirubrobacterales bacterium]